MNRYPFLPTPYPYEALEPFFSRETLQYHHGKHQKGYVDKLNLLLAQDPDLSTLPSLETLIKEARGAVFEQAAQVWNHQFFWESLAPINQGGEVEQCAEWILPSCSSLEQFKSLLKQAALSHFGSGWLWLYCEGKKWRWSTSLNAGNPLSEGIQPVACLDLWEHAHYIDYRNDKGSYFEAVWQTLHWDKLRERSESLL